MNVTDSLLIPTTTRVDLTKVKVLTNKRQWKKINFEDSSPHQQSLILLLPIELLMNILSFLTHDVASLLHSSQLSKRFFTIVHSIPLKTAFLQMDRALTPQQVNERKEWLSAFGKHKILRMLFPFPEQIPNSNGIFFEAYQNNKSSILKWQTDKNKHIGFAVQHSKSKVSIIFLEISKKCMIFYLHFPKLFKLPPFKKISASETAWFLRLFTGETCGEIREMTFGKKKAYIEYMSDYRLWRPKKES